MKMTKGLYWRSISGALCVDCDMIGRTDASSIIKVMSDDGVIVSCKDGCAMVVEHKVGVCWGAHEDKEYN